MMHPRKLILAIVLGAVLATGIWALVNLRRSAAVPTTATVLPIPVAIHSFSLLDHRGQAVDESIFRGQWDLVFFGFTNCPDICPLTLQALSTAKRRLADSGLSPLPRIVLVSVDPERDTPAKMARYIAAFGDDNLGITGNLEELEKLTSGLGIFFEKRESAGEHHTVDHSAAVIVIDPDGRFHSLFSSPHAVENFVHDLPLLMRT